MSLAHLVLAHFASGLAFFPRVFEFHAHYGPVSIDVKDLPSTFSLRVVAEVECIHSFA